MELERKLAILADAAKYDASCSSSGSKRASQAKGAVGNAHASGICHSWADDGRCISLLKILFSNVCVYDCAYCLNRRSNDVPRATFTVDEVVDLTMGFYKRNYIEGLFLSSAVMGTPDATMEKLLEVVSKLRLQRGYHGYIHMKSIPGASLELVRRTGLLVDRMSVNIELPSEGSLKVLAPEKEKKNILTPMAYIGKGIRELALERKKSLRTPLFVPAGQSTQLIVGASPESDLQILRLAEGLYGGYNLKRVYYSAYVAVNRDHRLPVPLKPPLRREHRLYQADWLLRYYGFKACELLDEGRPDFDPLLDPKAHWALRNMHFFPVEVNTADRESLLRVPGLGVQSVKRILRIRRTLSLDFETLRKIGVVLKRARYFLTCNGRMYEPFSFREGVIREALVEPEERQTPTGRLFFPRLRSGDLPLPLSMPKGGG